MDWYEFLPKRLNMSLTASVVILVVLVLRVLLQRVPKVISYGLWAVVLFRLLCPVAVSSPFSLFGLLDAPAAESSEMTSVMEYVPSDLAYADVPEETLPVPRTGGSSNETFPQGQEQTTENTLKTPVAIATCAWGLGALGMLGHSAAAYAALRRKLLEAVLLRDNIYLADLIGAPFVIGLFQPKIYLPSALEEQEQAYVLCHEQHHIRRLDHVIKALAYFALCMHWFNPLVWAAFVLAGRDMEMSCDEAVVRKMGETVRQDYAATLLTFATGRRILAGMPLGFGEGDPKGRIKNLAQWRKPAVWIVAAATAACAVIGFCLMTNPKEMALHAPEPFCHSYRISEVLYRSADFSYPDTAETAPQYSLSSDYAMFANDHEPSSWIQVGCFLETKLSPQVFDDFFRAADGSSGWQSASCHPVELRKETKQAWRLDAEEEHGFYYLLYAEDGSVYLSYGIDGSGGTDEGNAAQIFWLYKLERIDLLVCHANSEGINAYIEPMYYPNGFDFDYDRAAYGEFHGNGALIFQADWDTDVLTVGENYYENNGEHTVIRKKTYKLARNADGTFSLDLAHRNPDWEEQAIYVIQGKTGNYAMKIHFETQLQLTSGAKTQEALSPDASLEQAISQAILQHHTGGKTDGLLHTQSYVLLASEARSGTPMPWQDNAMEKVTVYLMTHHQAYSMFDGVLEEKGGSFVPAALTFSLQETGEYVLEEYWEPRDGAYYADDIRGKFPKGAAETLFSNYLTYLEQLGAECGRQADDRLKSTGGLELRITALLEMIQSSPLDSSDPDAYLQAHAAEVQELHTYGEYTLRYCFGEFLRGGQTGLRGHLMARICEDISGSWGEALLVDGAAPATGQDWFRAFQANAQQLAEQYSGEELEKYYPASWLLLQLENK